MAFAAQRRRSADGVSMRNVPEWLQTRNTESWQAIVRFYGRSAHLEQVSRVYGLVRDLAQSDVSQAFRAGQSMYRLIISTAERYGLTDDDAFLMVTPLESGCMELEYCSRSRGRVVKGPFQESQILARVREWLDVLWSERRLPSDIEPPC